MKKLHAEILTWTPLLLKKDGFPRDKKGNPYLPGRIVIQAIQSSVIFYYTGKDSFVEKRIRRYLSGGFRSRKAVPDILNIVIDRYDILTGLWVPDRIYIPEEIIKKLNVVIYDTESAAEVDAFETEAIDGVVEFEIEGGDMQKIATAAHSYSEALAKNEMKMLSGLEQAFTFYEDYINRIKKQEMPLRMGWWTINPFGGNFMFFWKVKDVREMLIRRYNLDILPRKIILSSENSLPVGWVEVKIKEEGDMNEEEA